MQDNKLHWMRIRSTNLAPRVNYTRFRFPLESVEDERDLQKVSCILALWIVSCWSSLSINCKGHLGDPQLMASCLYLIGMKLGHLVYIINVGHISELHNKRSSWSHLGKPKLNFSKFTSSQNALLGVEEKEEGECTLGEEIKHFLRCLLNIVVLQAQDVASLSNGWSFLVMLSYCSPFLK